MALRELADAIRSFPVALAHQMGECKPGDARLTKLNERYRTLTAGAQLACRAELLEMAEAKRGKTTRREDFRQADMEYPKGWGPTIEA